MIWTKAYEDDPYCYSRLVVYIKENTEYKIRDNLMSNICVTIWVYSSNGTVEQLV